VFFGEELGGAWKALVSVLEAICTHAHTNFKKSHTNLKTVPSVIFPLVN
jgi:hypothetical protein